MLADFGADVIKVERPGRGDDVRQQGLRARDADGNETRETSSFLAMNRGKRSITVDMAKPGGQALIRALAARSDILIENFKAGDLARYGLDYATLAAINPRLVYCSISGFGQDGPYAQRPGYDPLFQSMSGLMSITGRPDDEPGGGPLRVGYSAGDLNAGFYAVAAILAALRHRDQVSGQGQHIDLALLDAQVATISHVAQMFLVSGHQPPRTGNASPITCPWQDFACADGRLVVAVGNDRQFVAFCEVLGRPDLPLDPRFATNPERARHRLSLTPQLDPIFARATVADWHARFEAAGVPTGPINDFAAVFDDPQIRHRQMRISLPHATIGSVPQVANPVRFSQTPIRYGRSAPLLGEDTEAVLAEVLGLDADAIAALRAEQLI